MISEVNELSNYHKTIKTKVVEELKLSSEYYKNHKDETFEIEDHYYKFLLFTVYRGIEDLIDLLLTERKKFSLSKSYYDLISLSTKSNFITKSFFTVILNEIKEKSDIKYEDIYLNIKKEELSFSEVKMNNINEIMPNGHKKTEEVNIEIFLSIFNDCRNSRNKILHSVVKSVDLSKRTIINAYFVYSFLTLIIEKMIKSKI